MRMLSAPDRRQILVSGLALAPRSGWAEDAQPTEIGIMNDMSSVYSDYQGIGSVVAARLAVDDFLAKMGVPIEIVYADHQNKPDIGSAIAPWIDAENVGVIMDLPNSAVALAVLAVCEEKNRAVIGSGAGSSVLTGPKCSRNFVHWTYDTYAWGAGLGKALTEAGGKKWFFITADYAFGKDIEANCAGAVKAAGGDVVGSVRHPINTPDFSSFVLQAQNSGADVVALANAGGDTSNCLKQAHEFGLADKQKLASLSLNVTNVPSLGLEIVQGATICTGFYWDANDGTRPFAKQFQAARNRREHLRGVLGLRERKCAMAAPRERRRAGSALADRKGAESSRRRTSTTAPPASWIARFLALAGDWIDARDNLARPRRRVHEPWNTSTARRPCADVPLPD